MARLTVCITLTSRSGEEASAGCRIFSRRVTTFPVMHSTPVLHAITTDAIVARPNFAAMARAVMAAMGPRGALHLRAQRASGARLYALSSELGGAQDETGAWLVVNDRVDIALAVSARGAQLTSRSILPADARRVAPRIALGASVHTLGEAREAERGGADWLIAGHVHRTSSHPEDPARGPAFISEIVGDTVLPVVAIGGVLPEHVAFLQTLGVHGVAAIRGIWGEEATSTSDPASAARAYLEACQGTE